MPGAPGRDAVRRNVAFSAYLTNRIDGGPLARVIAYSGVVTSIGGGYNATTGIFTAPRSGNYAFLWSCLTAPGAIFDSELMVNGLRKSLNNCNNRDGVSQLTCTGMAIVKMKYGDKAYIRSIFGEFLYEDWSWFHGWLL
ncbi:hypothetical protein FSP39_007379 [Pinctada imbricata]|uniref:C1q domain-containing protein n=1 Tax=Pinctada imbricata TaxID=66713 RepID=A0AA89BY86_PINIB|nr:hypothetical protein FSP39_007379 [Pinctada imbricata]